eukprot:772878-Alexandrium_andersonii.AAC.1
MEGAADPNGLTVVEKPAPGGCLAENEKIEGAPPFKLNLEDTKAAPRCEPFLNSEEKTWSEGAQKLVHQYFCRDCGN